MQSLRSWMILGCLTLALGACGQRESYPYPATYLKTSEVPPTVLPAPTARQSAMYEAEIKTIQELQAAVTPAQKKRMTDEIKVRPEMVTLPVFGERFNRERLPKTFALLDRVGSDNWRISDAAKNYWNTRRPFLEEGRVKLLIPPHYAPAYPSGHTSAATVWAETLVLLLPRYTTKLRTEANEIALNRIRAGLHYPHDIAGGRFLAAEEMKKLLTKPKFRADMEAARAELRRIGWLRGGNPLSAMPLPERQSIMLQPI